MRIIKIIFSIFKREFLLNIRNVFDLLSIILFFFLGILIFVLSIGPSQDIIKKISIGIIWSLLLLSSTLSMKKIFQEDFNNGNMIIFYISGIALEFVVLVKIFASYEKKSDNC